MKYIIIFFNLIILSISSLKNNKDKLCINCKYFITDNVSDKFGKCSLFPKKENNDIYTLVNGIHGETNIEYNYCSVSRELEHMCGKEGKMYKKNILKRGFEMKKKRFLSKILFKGLKTTI